MKLENNTVKRHTIAVLVENEPGVLARVIGLFSGRGYNIESLTVAAIDKEENLSRITVVTSGTTLVIEQIKAQLNRLVPVSCVSDLTLQEAHIERELALIKVIASAGKYRQEALQAAVDFRARVVDETPDSFVFQIVDSTDKLDEFINVLIPLGRLEISRTGVAAITRGRGTIKD